MRRNAKTWAPAPLELNPNKRTLGAPRGRQSIGAGVEADRFVELAREGGHRLAAFERRSLRKARPDRSKPVNASQEDLATKAEISPAIL